MQARGKGKQKEVKVQNSADENCKQAPASLARAIVIEIIHRFYQVGCCKQTHDEMCDQINAQKRPRRSIQRCVFAAASVRSFRQQVSE